MKSTDVDKALEKHPFVCWFDRVSDCLCIIDRRDRKKLGLKEGEPIPEEQIFKVPLKAGELFVQAVLNSIGSDSTVSAILQGAIGIADGEGHAWLELGQNLRNEFHKRGAGVERLQRVVEVPADELSMMRGLEADMRRFQEIMAERGIGDPEGDRLWAKMKENLDGRPDRG